MKICAKCNNPFEEGIAYCPNDGSRLTTVSKLVSSGHAVPSEVSEQVAREEHGEDLINQTIAGRYTIRKRLGEGGMGVVYSGVDMRLEKDVAIKVLKEDFAHRTEVVTRFEQEAKSAARIKHENVLDVTDWGRTDNGSFYIAMELLVGTDLADALQKDHTIEPGRAVNIAIQVTRALAAAHAKGIVHRDLKPENVFLVASDAGREIVKIVDFGIAQMKDLSGEGNGNGNAQSNRKLTRTGMIFGTPEYMSPEQAAGKSIDHRVDVYAVGVILYEMLAGRVPFVGDTFMGVLTQHMFEPPPPITSLRPDAVVQPDLEAVIARALAKDPEQRYASMNQLAEDLSRVRDGERPSAATTPGATGTGGFRPARTSGAPGASNATPVVATRSLPTGVAAAPGGRRTAVTIAIVASVVVLGGAAVAYKTLGHERPPPITGEHSVMTVRSDHGVGANTGNVAIEPHAVAAASDAAVASPVLHVHVVTAPLGARVDVLDSDLSCGATPCGLACAATPCTLTVPRGREIHLRAGDPRHAHGELAVLPDHDGQDVAIALGATGATAPTHPNGGVHVPSTGTGTTARHGSRCRPGQLTYLDHDLGMYVQCGPQ